MKIVINKKSQDEVKNQAFDAIVETLFESKNVKIEEFEPERVWCVSMNGAPGSDYDFDYGMFSQGDIGQRIVIKSISEKIFGVASDPRPLVGIVQTKMASRAVKVKAAVAPTEIFPDPTPVESPFVAEAKKLGFNFRR